MVKKEYKALLISMSGVRVYNTKLMELGLTLPGFVDRSRVIASLPSLGLLTLAAHTPGNWEIIYREMDELNDAETQAVINEKPDLVAFSSLTARITETYALSSLFRKQGIKVVIGGLHVSALPEEAKNYADTVIQGEGEWVWPALLEDFENRRLRPFYSSITQREFTFHFQASKTPKYELLDITKYNRLTLQTSRGCPLHCNFCAASRTISSYKKKPIHLVEKELTKILEIWDRPFIELADDNTFIDRSWAKQLLRLFAKYNMKWFTETDISVAYDDELLELLAESHCAQVLIGLESSSRQSLQHIDRSNWKYKQYDGYFRAIEKIQSNGVSVNGCFIVGFDTDTKASIRETEQFIVDSNLSEVQITLLTPFPGTGLYRQLDAENRLLSKTFWNKCTLFDLNFRPKHFSTEELEGEFQNLMSAIYSPARVAERKNKFRQTLRNRVTNLTNHEYTEDH